jgi:hypothetical protein
MEGKKISLTITCLRYNYLPPVVQLEWQEYKVDDTGKRSGKMYYFDHQTPTMYSYLEGTGMHRGDYNTATIKR